METQCTCRECNEPMTGVWQPALLPGRDGMLLITCENKRCAMYQYTFSEKNYQSVDLSKYVPCTTKG